MNLRDKLRNQGNADTGSGQLDNDEWQAAPVKAEPKKGGGKSLLPALDVNRRFLFLAAGVAGLTAMLAVSYLSTSASGLAEGGTKVAVVVAAADIPAGIRLTEEHFTTKDVPKAYLPTGYFEDVEKLKDRVTVAPMVAGEPILEVRTSKPDAKYGIAYLLKSGERAKTISVDSASGLAGLIKPGNEVDLLATIPDPNDTNRRIGTPVIQKARVIAVGDLLLGEVRSPEEEAKESESGIGYEGTVTLAIPSGKTGLVTLLEDLGNLKMVLRAAEDDTLVKSRYTDEIIMAMVSGKIPPKEAPKPPAPRPQPKPRVIIREVVRQAPPPPRPRPVVRVERPAPQPKPVAPKPQPKQVEVIRFGQ